MVDAVVVGFLPGPLAGDVLTEFLMGLTNPSGKLPLTYPSSQDMGGVPYLHSVSSMCTDDSSGGTLPHWDNTQCTVQCKKVVLLYAR